MQFPLAIVVLAAVIAERVPLGHADNLRLVSLDGKTETWLPEDKVAGFGATAQDGAIDLNEYALNWQNQQLASEKAVLISTDDLDSLHASVAERDAEIETLKAKIQELENPTPVESAPAEPAPVETPPVVVDAPADTPPVVAEPATTQEPTPVDPTTQPE
jgi:hypothetical protein